MATELKDAIAVQFKHRIFLFGALDPISGIRALWCRPSKRGMAQNEIVPWAKKLGYNVVSIQSFLAMKPPMGSYCEALAKAEDEIDKIKTEALPQIDQRQFRPLAGETIIDEDGTIIDA